MNTYTKDNVKELMTLSFNAGFNKYETVEAGLEGKEVDLEVQCILHKYTQKEIENILTSRLDESWIDLNYLNAELEHNYIKEQNFLKEFNTRIKLTDKEIEDLKTKYRSELQQKN